MIKCRLAEAKDLNNLDDHIHVGYFECTQIPQGGIRMQGGKMYAIIGFYWELNGPPSLTVTDGEGHAADLEEAVCCLIGADPVMVQKRQKFLQTMVPHNPNAPPQPHFTNGR